MMKVYTNSGIHYINESLMNKIKEINPEILMEDIDMDKDVFNKNVDKVKDIIINKFNYPLNDRQKSYIEYFLDSYSEKVSEKELEYKSDNFLDIQKEMFKEKPSESFLEDIAYGILTNKNNPHLFKEFDRVRNKPSLNNKKDNVVSIEDKIKNDINDEIKEKATEKNGITQSSDVKKTTIDVKKYAKKKIKELQNSNIKYNEEEFNDFKQTLNYMTTVEEIDKAVEFFKQNYDEKGFKGNITDKPEYNKKPEELKKIPYETDVTFGSWDEAKQYVEKLQIFGKTTQQIVARSNHTILSTLNKIGSSTNNVLKNIAALAVEGYDYRPFYNVDSDTTIKYYLAALEVVDKELFKIVKNVVFNNSNNPKTGENTFEKSEQEREEIQRNMLNGISKCVYLFEAMNENDINDMYNAILFDEILSNHFKINSLNKLAEFGFRDKIIYFTKDAGGDRNLVSIFVFRKKLRKTRATFNYFKNFYNDMKNATPKV